MPEHKQLVVAAPALPVPDDELVRRVQAGNGEAFEELVRRYERKVYNITYRLMGNEQDASEALQDAFLRAYRFIGKFQFKSSFFTWLYRIATNVSLSKLRKREKVDIVSIDQPVNEAGDLPFEIPDVKYGPEKLMHQRELRAAIQKAVDELADDYRSVVVLRDLEGLSNEEVSKVLHLSVAAVKSRLHRGRLVLREKLKNHLPGGEIATAPWPAGIERETEESPVMERA
ncbi:MAG: sigma-70 family RNA polymerase sigma factor [candidate division WOR-3 bacterium]|nr:sigma-70 family RNA polymerase sigma factor [candidate division WOR-3 bacterium]